MKVFIDNQTIKNVFFLREIDLALFKAKEIPFKDLHSLLYYNISRDDLLSWISYQRAMEKATFGRKITTLLTEGELKFKGSKPKHDMDILSPLLQEVYDENKYYGKDRFYSYFLGHDTVVILSKNDTVLENGFKVGKSNIVKTLFQAVLLDVGFFKFYFNEPVKNVDHIGIGLPEIVAKSLG